MNDLTRPETVPSSFHDMVAASPQMHRVFQQVRRAGKSDSTVLVRGESGTGKELVARALHACSPRKTGPFRAVNCATFTASLLASELFGHAKGAFTGAVQDKQGLLQQANHGTLFLDEVAEIPVELQGQLLRVLQERRFVPVGGRKEIEVDLRLVSATNSSLRELVAERSFREDLMYRIRVIILRLPPLRERQGDLEVLTWAILDRLNEGRTRRIARIEGAAWAAMQNYDWPGNIRELQNNLEAAHVLGEGGCLTLDELAPELRGEGYEVFTGREPKPQGPSFDVLERERLVQVWEETGGHRGKMAVSLGVSRSTLYRKLRKAGLLS